MPKQDKLKVTPITSNEKFSSSVEATHQQVREFVQAYLIEHDLPLIVTTIDRGFFVCAFRLIEIGYTKSLTFALLCYIMIIYIQNQTAERQMSMTVNHEQPTEIKLSAEQEALFKIMEGSQQHLFITGRAGTGKSVLLRHFRENTKKRAVVAAPTGIAALNVRGQTIHSLFRVAPQLQRKGRLPRNSRVCTLLKRIDTLIVDEISMVRADLLDAINERLQEAFDNNLPFGGIQVIMFGDVYQLPPVVEEGLMSYFEAVHEGYFFFNALVWQQAEFKIYELTQVFRQKDPAFKSILNAVRDGTVIDEQIEQLNARHGVPMPEEGTLTLAPTNSLVTNINQKRLDQLEGKAYEYKATITGEMKRSTFPTEEVVQLKVGAQVVLLQNDKDKRWVNGTIATISKLKKDDEEKGITVHVDKIDYDLETTTWEEIRYEYDPAEGKVKEEVVSSFTQYPVRLAWAMTIHKSQGQTYESVALDLTTATFAPGQLYVALSRCTSLEGLYLKMPVKRGHIIVEPKVTAFMLRRETIKVEASADIIETCAQNQIEIVEQPMIEEVLCTQNQMSVESIKKRGGKREGAGRKRKEELKHVSVKLSDEQIEKTSGIDRSELIRSLLDANGYGG